VARAGTLDLVLSADSTQLRQELGKVRQESQATALAITGLFSNDTINAAGFRILRGTITGVIGDIDEMNQGLTLTESLTRNVANSFNDLGDIALLQLGQIAQFLGDDLFQTPLAGLQGAALESVGLGQLEGAFQIVSAGANAAKVAEPALAAIASGFGAIDDVLGSFQGKAQAVSEFFKAIAGNAQLAGSVLATTADLIDTAIGSLLDTLAAINPQFAALRDAVKSTGVEFSLGQTIFGEYIADLKKLEGAAAEAGNAADSIADGAGKARSGIQGASGAVDDFRGKLTQQLKAAQLAEGAMRELADAGTLLSVYNQANEIFESFFGTLEETFNAAKDLENLTNRLQVTSSSAKGAAGDLQFLSQTSDELGINFNAASEGFAKFSAATQQTSLRGAQTAEIFEQVAQATAVMRLSAADTEGVFLALSQSISGGTVQLEELNQLSERIPGTFQAASAALGVTSDKLRGLVSSGDVQSVDFIPKFAAQLAANTQSGVVGAANSAEAAVNRFNNALTELQVAMGKTWLEVGTPALNIFAEALKFATENEEAFSTAIDALLVAAVFRGISAVAGFTRAVFTSGKTIELFGKQITLSAGTLGKLAAQAALAYAAMLTFYAILRRFEDGGKGVRESIEALNKSLIDLKETTKEPIDIEKILPDKPPPTDFIDGALAQFNRLNSASNRLVGLPEDFLSIPTDAEKKLNDKLAAIGDLAIKTGEILNESLKLRNESLVGEGPINELKQVDALLKTIQSRKLGIDPKDAGAIAAIGKEEEALLARRAAAQKQVLATQAAVSNALEQYKRQLQDLNPGQFGADRFKEYETTKAGLETNIKLLEKEKTALDGVADTAVTTAKTIATSFEETSKTLEQSFSDNQVAIAEALARGETTEEESRQRSLDAEKDYLEEKLRLNLANIERMKAELENNAKIRAIDPAAATLSADQEKQYVEQVQQLELETAQTRIQLARSVTDAKKEALEEELDDLRRANDQAEALIQRTQTDRTAAVRERQLAGAVSEEEAAAQIAEIQQKAIGEEVALVRDKIAQIAELEQSGKLTAKEAADQQLELQGKLSDLNLQRIEQQLQAQENARRRQLESIETANQQAEAAIAQAQTSEITAVRQLQAQRVITVEQAEQQIAAIRDRGLDQEYAQAQQQLAQIEQLREQGLINEEEAIDRRIELEGALGELNQQRVEAEIAAQDRLRQLKIDSLDQELEVSRQAAEVQQGLNQISLGAIANQNNLLSAQSNLLAAAADLTQQRLGYALEDANAQGNTAQAEQLRLQIIDAQIAANEDQFAIKQAQLELQKEQNALELENQRIQAEIATFEAEVALKTARINGADPAVIAGLEAILGLRHKQVEAIGAQADAQNRANAAAEEALRLEHLRTSEALARTRALEQANALSAAGQGSASTAAGGFSSGGFRESAFSSGGSSRAVGAAGSSGIASSTSGSILQAVGSKEVGQLNEALRLVGKENGGFGGTQSLLTRVRAGTNPYLEQALSASGRDDILQLADQSRQGFGGNVDAFNQARIIDSRNTFGEAAARSLERMTNSYEMVASQPRQLNISTPDPVRDTGRILNDISRQQARTSKL
jgi:tape measure domain-containing protein